MCERVSIVKIYIYISEYINLYDKISFYAIYTKARRVLRYLNKHTFSNMKLTIYITDDNYSLK